MNSELSKIRLYYLDHTFYMAPENFETDIKNLPLVRVDNPHLNDEYLIIYDYDDHSVEEWEKKAEFYEKMAVEIRKHIHAV